MTKLLRCLSWWWADFRCACWRLGKIDNLTPAQHALIHAKLTPNQRRQMRNILASGEGPTL